MFHDAEWPSRAAGQIPPPASGTDKPRVWGAGSGSRPFDPRDPRPPVIGRRSSPSSLSLGARQERAARGQSPPRRARQTQTRRAPPGPAATPTHRPSYVNDLRVCSPHAGPARGPGLGTACGASPRKPEYARRPASHAHARTHAQRFVPLAATCS